MNVCKIEPPRPVRVRKLAAAPPMQASPTEDAARSPLAPSEKNITAVPSTGRLRTSDVPSRYKSGISSAPASAPGTPRRCASPTAGLTTSPHGTAPQKRAVSAERKRPVLTPSSSSAPSSPSARSSTPSPSSPSARPSTPSPLSSLSTTPVRNTLAETRKAGRRLVGSRAPDGLWPAMRNLSSSFQSDFDSVVGSRREKLTGNSSSNQSVKSLGIASTDRKLAPRRGRNLSKQSENSRPVENSNARVIDRQVMLGSRASSNGLWKSLDLTDKATRSVSSTGIPRGVSPRRAPPAFDFANASLQQSSTGVSRKLSFDGSKKVERDVRSSLNSSSQSSERSLSAPRPIRTGSSTTSVSLRHSSPSRVSLCPSSPNSILLAPSTPRAMPSPSKTKPSSPTSSFSNATSSVFNYIIDLRKGSKSESQVEDAHQLKLLYNSDLQWHLVNAHADDVLASQKTRTENLLCNVWNNISKLRDSVITKRIYLEHLRQEMKLMTILNEQMTYLEDWVTIEGEHFSSLSGAFEALKANTLCLPVTGGARANVQTVNGTISSAVDVMQAMGSTICYLLSKVDGTGSLVSELAIVVAEEKTMLDECRELLSSVGAVQVAESSLRTHLIQLKQNGRSDHQLQNLR